MTTQSDDYVNGALDTLAFLRAVIDDQVKARTKPVRIPEPGLYGVVEASLNRSRETWLHTINGWSNGYHCHPWSALIDPTLTRDGIQ